MTMHLLLHLADTAATFIQHYEIMIWWNYNWMYMFHESWEELYVHTASVCVCNNDCEWDVIENQNRITSFNLFCAHAIIMRE